MKKIYLFFTVLIMAVQTVGQNTYPLLNSKAYDTCNYSTYRIDSPKMNLKELQYSVDKMQSSLKSVIDDNKRLKQDVNIAGDRLVTSFWCGLGGAACGTIGGIALMNNDKNQGAGYPFIVVGGALTLAAVIFDVSGMYKLKNAGKINLYEIQPQAQQNKYNPEVENNKQEFEWGYIGCLLPSQALFVLVCYVCLNDIKQLEQQ